MFFCAGISFQWEVLDEADRLLNDEIKLVLTKNFTVIPRERKKFVFGYYDRQGGEAPKGLSEEASEGMIEPASKYSTVDTLKQQYYFVPAKYKDCHLIHILTEVSGSMSMVFTKTCVDTRILSLALLNLDFRAITINGDMSQAKGLESLNKFKVGECSILVCTDLASRGLDIPSVDMVINYNIPRNLKDYIHRVGRTARAGRSGVAISLVSQYDLEWYLRIEKLIDKKLPGFEVQEEEVFLLFNHVTEAKRISWMLVV